MDDDLLYTLRREPDAAFADRLRAALRHQASAGSQQRGWPIRRLVTAAVVVLAVSGLLSVPAVRASAQSFLALFRVVNFVAVPVSNRNTVGITSQQLDLPRLL